MIHQKQETFICEHCGVDFTDRSYSDRIGHSNMTSNFGVLINRFDSAESPEDFESEILDAIDMDDNRTPYDNVVENVNCLIKALENGISVYKDEEFSTEQFPKYAKTVKKFSANLKDLHNAKINKKIDKVVLEYESKIKMLKSSLKK